MRQTVGQILYLIEQRVRMPAFVLCIFPSPASFQTCAFDLFTLAVDLVEQPRHLGLMVGVLAVKVFTCSRKSLIWLSSFRSPGALSGWLPDDNRSSLEASPYYACYFTFLRCFI